MVVGSNKALTIDRVAVPGVDVVFQSREASDAAVHDPRTLKLIGALHRRFWNRRHEMLQRRTQVVSDALAIGASKDQRPTADATLFADFTEKNVGSWDERVNELNRLIESVQSLDAGLVKIRGWADIEPGVLVDGRAVPGCVFDLAVSLSSSAVEFREGREPFVFTVPEPADSTEDRLWFDLIALAEDRLGVERGAVKICVEPGSTAEWFADAAVA
ncbi:MAG: malate synthase [Verrucomicrobiales bacterium]|jgi:malate synthase